MAPRMKKRKEKMGIIWDLQRIRKVFPFISLSHLKRASHFQGGARRARPSGCNNFNVTCYRRLPPTTSFGFKLDRWLVCSPRCRVGDANANLRIASRHRRRRWRVVGGQAVYWPIARSTALHSICILILYKSAACSMGLSEMDAQVFITNS